MKNRKIRIISGKWKGRYISVVNQLIRPTTSRIRETLFNWLNPVISNAICLDCFAGSGALGLESLSRGAQKVIFIDNNLICIKSLSKTIQIFQANNTKTIYCDCRYWIQQSNDSFNIIFIDPPFSHYFIISDIIQLLERHRCFQQQSWIYIETPKNQHCVNFYSIPKFWQLYRKKSTQFISVYLFYRKHHH